ncbi:MAG: XRE family transcriptional regulator [Candidatus Acidiferrales bacterium]
MKPRKRSLPEWTNKILKVRHRLGLNQSEFAARLNYSAMALSRWESGSHEPTSEAYIQMGNLAGEPEASWFWTRAGMKSADVSHIFPEGGGVLREANFPDFEIVVAGSGRKVAKTKAKTKLVAVPVLDVHAGTHGRRGDHVLDLQRANVAEMIAAPLLWCPHPSSTSCLRVRGSSMSPAINDGDIVAVDCSEVEVSTLNDKVVVAWNRKTGLTLSRFLSVKDTQLLQSESRGHEPILLGKDRDWRIIGKVLWSIRRSP